MENPARHAEPVRFETHPDRYRHWKLSFDGPVARLLMDVREDATLVPGYALKLNSYDLGVDIELADAVQRLRFEHPEVKAVVVTSGKDRIFSAGANIYMLATSTHPFKVNFCKFTNETRLAMEQASALSGQRYLAALNGITAGGGYELALACDEILLVDDGSSAVSLPEAPLLGVLPGTGGLTRLVDKRKVRRDHADQFSTLAEGIKGPRAVEWRLVDQVVPRSRFEAVVRDRATAVAAASKRGGPTPAIRLAPLDPRRAENKTHYRYVDLDVDPVRRVATLTVRAPDGPQPETPADVARAGSDFWGLRVWREVDDALLDLRFNRLDVGVVVWKTAGDPNAVLAVDRTLARHADDWLVREITLHMRRVLKRVDVTARTFFAVIDAGSAFAGSLYELALASDRAYMLRDDAGAVKIGLGPLNAGALPMSNGLSRIETRFLADPARAAALAKEAKLLDAKAALEAGLVTSAPDEIDWEDEVRVAIEERASLSPDAMTGMEASLRFAGPETIETKIFGRLSAWQNWIFQRPNAVGDKGALSLYGKPERPSFDWRRC